MLTREQQKENQKKFEDAQRRYNETHDVNIVWNELYPLIKAAAGPSIKKQNRHHEVQDYDIKVENACLLLVDRYLRKPDYHFQSLATLVYWAAKSVCFSEEVQASERAISYEALMEKRMREEHIAEEF